MNEVEQIREAMEIIRTAGFPLNEMDMMEYTMALIAKKVHELEERIKELENVRSN